MAASEADMDTLLQFIAQGGQFTVDRKGNIVAPGAGAGAATALSTATTGVSADDLRAQRASITAQREADRQADRQTRAQRQADRDAQAQADRQARQTRVQQRAQQQAQQQADARRRRVEERNAKSARAPFDAVTSWVEGLPTPGGNLALLLILLFFAFAIIPVNGGATRLELIWLVLTGGADLPTTAAGTGGNTQTSTPGVGDIAAGLGTGLGTAAGVAGSTIRDVLTGGASGGGPGLPGLDAGFAPFVPSADLAPSR